MVNIFHICTNPADGNNYHKDNNQYISVFVNQVHHTTIEYRNQYLRMYFAALDLQYLKLQYVKLQYQYLKYQNIKYTISHISISHIQISYIQNTEIGGVGFKLGSHLDPHPRPKFVTPIARDIYNLYI